MSASNLTVTAVGSGQFLIDDGIRQRVAYGVAAGDARWVFLEGAVYVLQTEPAGRTRGRQADDAAALASPMPATVVLVNVEPGQQVASGDLLVMLEAMKMEVAIKAPRNARVKSVNCRRGELVQAGVPLLELEPEPEPGTEHAER